MNEKTFNEELEERIIKLVELGTFLQQSKSSIKVHDHNYYVLANPTISDYDYDMLVKIHDKKLSEYDDMVKETVGFIDDNYKLGKIDYESYRRFKRQLNELINNAYSISVLTLKVGNSLSTEYAKKKHIYPMLSLMNTYNYNEVYDYLNNIREFVLHNNSELSSFVVEDKIDGLSCSLRYSKGELELALTRGDGETGEVITRKVLNIESIPKNISKDFQGEIRGELVLMDHDFDKILTETGFEYKNPRNAAAGIIRMKKSDLDSYLSFIAYDVIEENYPSIVYKDEYHRTHTEDLNFLKSQGFTTPNYKEIEFDFKLSKDDILKIIETEITAIKFNLKEYTIDGAVIKYNDKTMYEAIGRTVKFPKHSVAYKYSDDVYITTIKNIVWQVGRTGRVTPVAEVEPVEIDGSTVSRATLHNIEQMVQLGNVSVGKEVEIIKSAAVIPKILRVVNNYLDDITCKKIDKIDIPKYCPSCGTELIIDGPELICTNENCKDRVISSIVFFCGRDYMNITGLSIGIIEKLYNLGFIKNVADLYRLVDRRDELIKIPGMGEKSIDKILNNIELSKKNDLYRLIAGLGFESVGKKVSKDLANKYGNLENIAKIDNEAELLSINGFGDSIVKDVMKFIKSVPNIIDIFINKFGINDKCLSSKETINSELKNKVFVFTGTYSLFTRKEYEHEVMIRSGKVSSSVNKNTSYLVLGNNGSESKVKKANELNINIINEEQLCDIINKK